MSEDAPSFYQANLQRGILLRGQKRFKEASQFLGEAIAAEPDKAEAYVELAHCLNDWGGHGMEAIGAIDRAIGLEPNNADFLGVKGWILVVQGQYPAALRAARAGVELNPFSITALNAEANAHTKMGDWKQAEATSRRILQLNVHDAAALNLLAQALRLQGRGKESREVVARLLALLPDNSFGHMNAGYDALNIGDHIRANEHFLISLRMDPHCHLAKVGLLQSLRSRVWIYRHSFRLGAFLRGSATPKRTFISVTVLIGIGVLIGEAQSYSENVGSAVVLLGFFYFIMLRTSRPLGDFFLMFDPMGRHALSRKNKFNAWLIGLPLGLFLLMAAAAQDWPVAGGIALYLGFFAFSIYYPQIKDRWQTWRQSRREAAQEKLPAP